MRPNLNSAVAYLREMRVTVPDDLIEQVVIADVVTVCLKFPTEEFIANFGSNYLPHARVERVVLQSTETSPERVVWKAHFNWRKKPFLVVMRVDEKLGLTGKDAFTRISAAHAAE